MAVKQVAPVPEAVEKATAKAPDLGVESMELTASTFTITDTEEFQRAGEFLRILAAKKKQWIAYWAPVVSGAKAAYDIAKERRDEPLKRLEDLRCVFETEMSRYKIRQAQKREKMEAEMTAASTAMKARALEAAERALIAGRVTEAQIHQQQAELIPDSPKLPNTEERIEGVPQVDVYDVEVTDLMALIQAAAKGKIPLSGIVMKKEQPLFDVRESVIKSYVASMGANFNWPGVKVTKRVGYRPRSN